MPFISCYAVLRRRISNASSNSNTYKQNCHSRRVTFPLPLQVSVSSKFLYLSLSNFFCPLKYRGRGQQMREREECCRTGTGTEASPVDPISHILFVLSNKMILSSPGRPQYPPSAFYTCRYLNARVAYRVANGDN